MSVLFADRPAASITGCVRVMVVDDSAVVRGLVSRWIDAEPDLRTVAALRTGRDAVEQFERFDPDVVVLDVEMPALDGLAALPLLLAKKRDLAVIMASAPTRRHAELSIKALALGAADYVPKPLTHRGVAVSSAYRGELVEKVRQLGRRRPVRPARAAAPSGVAQIPAAGSRPTARRRAGAVALRPMATTRPRALLVGASTGGPHALVRLLTALGDVVARVPVLIVQHMPATFTATFAEHLSRTVGCPVHEAIDGEAVVPGAVYVAPGGRHMRVERRHGRYVVAIDDGPPVNFCKPALDPLFASAGAAWGSAALAVVLTGMGADGTGGARALVAAGGSMIAQDEATSVVWGMPGSVAQAGLCAAVLPLDEIGPRVAGLVAGDAA